MITFGLMWFVFSANTPEHQTLFQSGWFVVGLLTQTLIVHMIRTAQIPFIQSRRDSIINNDSGDYVYRDFLTNGSFSKLFKTTSFTFKLFLYLPLILGAYMCYSMGKENLYPPLWLAIKQ